MSTQYDVQDFPTFPISSQLFYVPGAVADGGFTSGGVRIQSPEPGGYSRLDIRPSLQVGEWRFPMSSWLMSQGNGEILRVRLAPTPQIATSRLYGSVPWGAEDIYPQSPWSNMQEWEGDVTAVYETSALQGSNVLKVDMLALGPILQQGHVIGHANETYFVHRIAYDTEGVATITVKPTLRRNVAAGDTVYFRPWFTGQIMNIDSARTTYDAMNNGSIQMNTLTLSEVIVP